MKQIAKPALIALREIEEVRASLNRRVTDVNVRILELSQHLTAHTKTLSPIDRAKALIAGEAMTQNEPEELQSQRIELTKLHAALRETEQPLQLAQTAASAEHCREFIPRMIGRKRGQVEVLKALQQLNFESDEMTLEIHRAGFDLAGGLSETLLFVDELEWHIDSISKDVIRHEIENADHGEAVLSVRMLSAGRTNGNRHEAGDLLELPEKTARLTALDGQCEVVTPELLRVERTARISRIAA